VTYSEVKDLLNGHGRRKPSCLPVRASVPSAALFGPSPATGRCLSCRVPFDEAEVVRIQLFDLSVGRMRAEAMVERSMEATRPLLLTARKLEIGPTELAQLTGLSRQWINHLITEEEGKTTPSER
jgi:hypothetical protein